MRENVSTAIRQQVQREIKRYSKVAPDLMRALNHFGEANDEANAELSETVRSFLTDLQTAIDRVNESGKEESQKQAAYEKMHRVIRAISPKIKGIS